MISVKNLFFCYVDAESALLLTWMLSHPLCLKLVYLNSLQFKKIIIIIPVLVQYFTLKYDKLIIKLRNL